MDARKILQDLQYRISTAPEGDPERENAIRLRDRLWPVARNLIKIYRRELVALQKKIQQEAAAALDDIIFPTNHLKCNPKQLPRQI